MLRSKTVMSKFFLKLKGLPEDVRRELQNTENDGAFLFAPAGLHDKESSYQCLSCGAHGKAALDLPICPECGNSKARPFRCGYSEEPGETEIRLVSTVDDFTVIYFDAMRIDLTCEESIKELLKQEQLSARLQKHFEIEVAPVR